MFTAFIISKSKGDRGFRRRFAAQVGISPSHLSALEACRKVPSLDLAHRIETATGGAVPMRSWVDRPDDGCACSPGSETVAADGDRIPAAPCGPNQQVFHDPDSQPDAA
ncbi:hypothetical protein ACEYYA_00810 [Paracoccus sp. p3-h83]|uniref:hypothetical protein n=1 Tax=Paracoccus sp. p3-h83 TaxID=3342805 RepID=UPI0035BAAED0